MSRFGEQHRRVLQPVIEVARDVLRRFDDPEVPPKLRRVAAYSGGSLPAPLASALLVELDRNDWFRGKVQEAWHERDDSDPLGTGFLDRPPGWWLGVADAAGTAGSESDAARAAQAEAQVAELERRLQVSRQKGKALADRAEAAEVELRSRDTADTAPLRSALDTANRTIEAAEHEARRAEKRIRALEAERDAVTRKLADARREHRRLREERAGLLRRLEAGRDELGPMTPDSIAGELDQLFVRLRPFREFSYGVASPEQGAARPALPAGVAPDSAAAIDALRAVSGPLTVLVDGHNMLGVIGTANLAEAGARRHLVNRLGRLRAALNDRDVVVVFDSSLDEGRGGYRSDVGVEVAFAVGPMTADDEIVRLAGVVTGPVVVSDDREVRERSFRSGALTLWARALIDWLE